MKNPKLHFFNRLAFGARPEDLEVGIGAIEGRFERQLHPADIPDEHIDPRLAALSTLTMTPEEFLEAYPERRQWRIGIEQLTAARLLRAAESRRQLQEVMVDFWFNHFNVFAGKGLCRILVSSYERDAIRPHALGKFRDLVSATASHPAMLFYLDNWLSASPGARRRGPRKGLNENYARELMELHTLGVDGGYSQEDIVEVARAFTGWTIRDPRRPVFVFAPHLHDRGRKSVLGRPIDGGGIRDGEQVIDLLCRHPSTARFIATKLARRFVSDDPPPGLIDTLARTFTRTDGDIREILRAIVRSRDFAESEQVKVKTPFEFVVSSIRALDAGIENPRTLARFLGQMGQPLYLSVPPTGYPDEAADWMSAGTLMMRLNFVSTLAAGRFDGIRIEGRQPEQVVRLLGTPEFQRR